SLPANYDQALRALLEQLGFRLPGDARRLAEAVLKLSDLYTREPLAVTPWAEGWAQAAHLAYYFPLNYARNLAVAREGLRLGFFNKLQSIVDFGSGSMPALLAVLDALEELPEVPQVSAQAWDLRAEGLKLGLALRAERHSRHQFSVQS